MEKVRIIIWGINEKTDSVLDSLQNSHEVRIVMIAGQANYSNIIGIPIEDKSLDECFEICDYIIYCKDIEDENSCEEKLINADSIINNVKFDLLKYIELKKRNISIVSSSNWGKRVYQSLYLKNNSPFCDITIDSVSYIKMLQSFEKYMNMDLMYVCDSTIDSYVTGKLGDINIQFTREETFEAAKYKWNANKELFNWDNYLFEMDNFDNIEQLKMFLGIPKKEKLAFYHAFEDLLESNKSVVKLTPWTNNKIRKDYRWFDMYVEKTAFRDYLGIKPYDIINLLLGEENE